MTEPHEPENDPDLKVQQLLLAANNHDLTQLRTMLRNLSPNVQDPETGFTPLHAAIAACEDDDTENQSPYLTNGTNTVEQNDESSAVNVVRLLLQSGAIWNTVSAMNETPGCLALRLHLKELYEIMVDAGVRSEMLLSRLEGYQNLADDSDSDNEASEEDLDTPRQSAEAERNWPESGTKVDDLAQGVVATEPRRAEYLNAAQADPLNNEADAARGSNNEDYLASSLHFSDGRIIDDSGNGVMMAWETGLMRRTAELLCPFPGLRVLNVGHGLGIIDSFFQSPSHLPIAHHIIEAHPAVLARMHKDGWGTKTNVTIHPGRWQDVVPALLEQSIMFDAIYFDTFAEDYQAFRNFADNVIGLLDEGGKWGFFHGLGADRQICHDVYTKIVEMDLFEAGYDVEWKALRIEDAKEKEWEGVKRKYWTLKEYRLPICTFIG